MRSRTCLALLALGCIPLFTALLFSEVDSSLGINPAVPKDPAAPTVTIENKNSEEYSYRVDVTYGDGRSVSGYLLLSSPSISYTDRSKENKPLQDLPLSSVQSIEVIRWFGKEYRKNSYVFYPAETRLLLWNGAERLIQGDLPMLHKMRFRRGTGKTGFLYSYFYDYWINGKWENNGSSDTAYHESNPHPDSVIMISFNKPETKNITEEILNKLTR